MPWRAAAPFSTSTSCPWATASRTEAGVMPTRYSWTLISLGTPMRIGPPFGKGEWGVGSGKAPALPLLPAPPFLSRHGVERPCLRHLVHVPGQVLQPARHRAAVGPVEQLHGMGDGNVHRRPQLGDAADVAGGHHVRSHA